MMLAYRLKERLNIPGVPRREVIVRLRSDNEFKAAELEIVGDARTMADVKESLFRCYGFAGAFIESVTRPVDLELAMKSKLLEVFDPEPLDSTS
jgi:hypothetical protein